MVFVFVFFGNFLKVVEVVSLRFDNLNKVFFLLKCLDFLNLGGNKGLKGKK